MVVSPTAATLYTKFSSDGAFAGSLNTADNVLSPTASDVKVFTGRDTTVDVPLDTDGSVYTGPVTGILYEYVDLTPDNLNITSNKPNCFIHSGSGFDAIDVSKGGGTNVLDGGTNSNFLVGSTTGSDTFFVDDRGPSTDIWSSIVNFHKGDAATLFGINPTGYAFDWENNQGAAGATGLTLHVTKTGAPTASITLAGYSLADLSNGRLGVQFGNETDGTPYLYVKGN